MQKHLQHFWRLRKIAATVLAVILLLEQNAVATVLAANTDGIIAQPVCALQRITGEADYVFPCRFPRPGGTVSASMMGRRRCSRTR